MMQTYFVSWRFHSRFHQIDVDDENRALALCVALAELNEGSRIADERSEIAITGVDFEIDPEVQKRIKETIMARLVTADDGRAWTALMEVAR